MCECCVFMAASGCCSRSKIGFMVGLKYASPMLVVSIVLFSGSVIFVQF